jgi:hypothetical protein
MSDENVNPDAPLHIRGLNHLTIPSKIVIEQRAFTSSLLALKRIMNRRPIEWQRVCRALCNSAFAWPLALKSIYSNKTSANRTGISPIPIWPSTRQRKIWKNGPSISRNGGYLLSAR